MKKIVISAFMLLLTVAGASAQDLPKGKGMKTPDEKSVRFTQRLSKELNLDAAQQQRVQGINLDRFKQIEELKNMAGLDGPSRRQKMKSIEEAYVTSMKGVLNAEQFPKFEALRAEIKEKAFERRKGK
jgi:protein CpxP